MRQISKHINGLKTSLAVKDALLDNLKDERLKKDLELFIFNLSHTFVSDVMRELDLRIPEE